MVFTFNVLVLHFDVLVLHFWKGRAAISVFPVFYCPIFKLQPWIWIWIQPVLTVKLLLLRVAGGKELLAFRWIFFTFFSTVFKKNWVFFFLPSGSTSIYWVLLSLCFLILYSAATSACFGGWGWHKIPVCLSQHPSDLDCEVIVGTLFLAIFSFSTGWLSFLLCHYRSVDKKVTDKPQY